jgi:DNA-binding transcriptional MerR regulator
MSDQSGKLYYTISEVARITGVKAHVLRYWEGEFPTLQPRKTRSGSRRYRQKDIDAVLTIKGLLYDQGFRIEGARKALRQGSAVASQPGGTKPAQMAIPFAELDAGRQLAEVRDDVGEIMTLIRELRSLTCEESGAADPAPSGDGGGLADEAREG